MPRQVQFRAKVWNREELVYGFLFELLPPLQCVGPVQEEDSVWYIVISGFADWNMPRSPKLIRVHPETVAEWVGFNDVHNVEIYEGDRIRCLSEGDATVVHRRGCFGLLADNTGVFYPFSEIHGELEVIVASNMTV